MPAESSAPSFSVGPYRVPYSLISLVTLTVQNSALAILLHYSRTAPDAKPYSAAAAVLLNEILKGSISFGIALNNLDPLPTSSGAGARYSPETSPTLAHSKRLSLSVSAKRNREHSIGGEESWKRKSGLGLGLGTPSVRQRAWWLRPSQYISRSKKVLYAVFSPDCWKLAVPACCYVLQNNLQFVAASNLDVATFQVTYQAKILTTAFFSVTMLHKRLSTSKWACLVALAAGVAIVQLQGSSSGGSSSPGHANMDRTTGFIAVVLACMTSGFAGVYFEKVLKGSTADLWVRNIQLTLFSLLPAFAAAMFPEFSLRELFGPDTARMLKPVDPNAPTWLFGNFGGWALATVFCQVFGGLVTALVIRYSDNIAKGFATSLSIIISFVAGVILFNFHVTPQFLVGCSVVLASTYYYNQPEGDSSLLKSKPALYSPLPMTENGHANGIGGATAFAVEVVAEDGLPNSTGATRRHMSVDQGGPDPAYPFSEYPGSSKLTPHPKFINLAPFSSPKVAPPLEHEVSPRSPNPPFIESMPFGPPMRHP